ncbi:hypothetical protein JCM3770_007445 [Rhodotorula araucariae]
MADAAEAAQELIEAYDKKLTKVAPGAVGIQLALMAGVGLAALCAFSILRPKNSIVYQPKVKYAADEKRPPKIGKGLLDWIAPVVRTNEQEMLATIGLDSVTYLRFLRMCRNMFLCIATLTCAILIPINVYYNLKYVNRGDRNYLLMLTMSQVRGNWLWAHVAVTYVITGITLFFVWRYYAAVVRLRWQWFRSPAYQDMLYARSLMITHVNKKYQTDAGLHSLLASLKIPYPTTAVHIGRRVGALRTLIKKHNEAVTELEKVLTRYLRNSGKAAGARPTKRVGGWMGLGSQKVDLIDYLTEKIKRLEERVELARQQIHERKAENYGFASFESVPYAHIVAKKLRGRRRQNAQFELAPQPSDLIWENLTMGDAARRKNKFFGGVLLLLLCGFYIIPLAAVALLANLAALVAYVDFINNWVNNYPWLFSAFIGIVPPVLTLLLQMILPMIIRWIASMQGATTHSQSDRIVTAHYSAFLFITQFFIFSLLGVLVQIISQVVVEVQGHKSFHEILDYLETVPDKLQYTYMIQSNYWLTVFPLRGAAACFDLAQIVSLFLVWSKKHMFGRTPREIREATKPPFYNFPVYYSDLLLLVVVALVYAPIAPLVALFGVAAFAIIYAVGKYTLLYVAVPRNETGGRLWNVAINRCLMALLLMHLFMAVSIGLLTNWYRAIALVPPAVAVPLFKILLNHKFLDRFRWYIPTSGELAQVRMHRADARKNRLEKRFGHDALSEPLFTPMLHKSVQHLLPTIYNGRIGQCETKFGDQKVEQNTAGGLTFAMLDTHNLEADRYAYLRQRDEDEGTVTTVATLGGQARAPGSVADSSMWGGDSDGGADGYFAARRAEYLKHGARTSFSGSWYSPASLDKLPPELQRTYTSDDRGSAGSSSAPDYTSTSSSSAPLVGVGPPGGAEYAPVYGSPRTGASGPYRVNRTMSSFSTLGSGGLGHGECAAPLASPQMAQYAPGPVGTRPEPQRQRTAGSLTAGAGGAGMAMGMGPGGGDWRGQYAPQLGAEPAGSPLVPFYPSAAPRYAAAPVGAGVNAPGGETLPLGFATAERPAWGSFAPGSGTGAAQAATRRESGGELNPSRLPGMGMGPPQG